MTFCFFLACASSRYATEHPFGKKIVLDLPYKLLEEQFFDEAELCPLETHMYMGLKSRVGFLDFLEKLTARRDGSVWSRANNLGQV